jgi:tetratricopeptide (TPR) repeat protein
VKAKTFSAAMLTLLLIVATMNSTLTVAAAKAFDSGIAKTGISQDGVAEANKDNGVSSNAKEKIEEAKNAIAEANQTILTVKSKGVDVSQAEYLLDQAVLTLTQANLAFEKGDYSEAIQYANKAESLAKKAVRSANKASAGIGQSSEERENALQAIADAEEAIASANETIINAQNIGVNVTDAMTILNQSVVTFSEAVEALNSTNLESAAQLAERSKELAEEAVEAAESAMEQYDEEVSEQAKELAQKAISNATEAILTANQTINHLRFLGINVTAAEDLLLQANTTLQDAVDAFEGGNFQLASGLAAKAEGLAENAKVLAESAQNTESVNALQKISEAEALIAGVEQKIQNAPVGVNAMKAIQILNLSSTYLSSAKTSFDNGGFTQATELANSARQEALNAEESIEEAVEEFENRLREEAKEVIEAAEAALLKLEERIRERGAEGINVTAGISIFNAANTTLRLAKHALETGLFEEAKTLAKTVTDLCENGLAVLNQLSKPTGSDLETSEDDQGNTLITSSAGHLTMSASTPSVTFNYQVNGTSVDFGVEFLSFVEFMDVNHDNMVQEGEVLQTLRLEDAVWNKTLQIQTVGSGQVVNIIYSAKSSVYDIVLKMQVYKNPTMISASLDNATVVFGIDGAAMETKITIVVNEWPWLSNSSRLSLGMVLGIGAQGTVSEESLQEGNLGQILFNASNALVKTEWLTKAKIIRTDGSESFASVGTAYEAEQKPETAALNIYFVYPNFEGSMLEHDPNVGVELFYVPAVYVPMLSTWWLSLGSGITVTCVVIVVFLTARRREQGSIPRTSYASALWNARCEDKREGGNMKSSVSSTASRRWYREE